MERIIPRVTHVMSWRFVCEWVTGPCEWLCPQLLQTWYKNTYGLNNDFVFTDCMWSLLGFGCTARLVAPRHSTSLLCTTVTCIIHCLLTNVLSPHPDKEVKKNRLIFPKSFANHFWFSLGVWESLGNCTAQSGFVGKGLIFMFPFSEFYCIASELIDE